MRYMVVPFVANIHSDQGAEEAAKQLEELINSHMRNGWQYLRMENIEINIHDPGIPGKSGCFGFGADPGVAPSTQTTRYDMVVFSKSD